MNSLSWFLYFAGVVNGLGVLLFMVGLLMAAGLAAYAGCHASDGDHTKWKYIPLAVIPWLLCALIPNQSTMYAIAASEMGEEVYKSDIGQKTRQAIEAWIDSQIPKPNQPK